MHSFRTCPVDPDRRRLMPMLGACAVAPLLVLTGCQSKPVPLPPPAASTPVPGSAPGPARGAGGEFAWTRDAESAQTAFQRYLGGGASVRRTDDNRVWVVLPGDAAWADGRAALQPAARRWLDQVALVMKAWGAAELRLVGHTDPRGGASANDALSLERAASARDWLVARGVAARRIAVAGRGSRDAGAPGGDRRLELLFGERAR
jgi:outer membrane protein OmpA-like peptidoglycan-associated protein